MRAKHWILMVAVSMASIHANAAETARDWRFFASIGPLEQLDTDLDGGGDFKISGATLRAGATRIARGGHTAGVMLSSEYASYEFSPDTVFGAAAPWKEIQRINISAPMVLRRSNRWSVLLNPSVEQSKARGASASEAWMYGFAAAALHRFDAERMLGLGVAVQEGLEKTRVLPVVLVDWKLTDRWRIANPTPTQALGNSGVELSYRLDQPWKLGAGASFRYHRFRLNEAGPLSDGIGEQQAIVAFLHATRALTKRIDVDLFAAMTVDGHIKVDDSQGHEWIDEDFDAAPLFGAALSAQF